MSKESLEIPYLHTYPQLDNHVEAWVVGNVAGLKALRKAINRALKTKALEGETVFAGDNEGYRILVAPCTDDQMGSIQLPYVDSHTQKSGPHPYCLVSKEAYIKAMRGK